MEQAVQHLVGLRTASRAQIEHLLDRAAALRDEVKGGPLRTLAGRTVGLLFLEPSTRTRFSFEKAARALGADVVSFTGAHSSTSKGETLIDTAATLAAIGVDAFVIRHKKVGAPALLVRALGVPVVNAGDGMNEHPTQALLDALTLRDHLGSLDGRTIAIVGDVRHSRVARSNCYGLTSLGARVVLCGPRTLCPPGMAALGVDVSADFDSVLTRADAVMMLRVQRERLAPGMLPSNREYARMYGLNDERLARLAPHVPVLHPGPSNRGVEISDAAHDGSRSLIRRQVTNGVAIRMAALEMVMGGGA
jgi:aspartate carbamoyltransferase catalytic subunit